MDYEAEGLLDGLEGQARARRAELLDWLLAEGYSPERIREGHELGLLVYLPAEQAVSGGPPTLTALEMAQRTNLDIGLIERLRRVQGLPIPERDAVAYREDDVHALAMLGGAAALGYGEDEVLAVARVLGRGLSQAAHAMRSTTLGLALEPGLSERELAKRYGEMVAMVMPYIGPMIDRLLRMHLRNMVRTEGVGEFDLAEGRLPGARPMAIAFADLVGFTRLGEEVPPDELSRVADRLGALAAETVAAPVQLVKTIGDAAMLVSDDAAALVRAGLDIVDAIAAEGADFPQVRVGVAYGQATARGGDWFGAPVNVASRVTGVARVGSVLATQELHEAAGEDGNLLWSHAGSRSLRGVGGSVRLFRARRADGN